MKPILVLAGIATASLVVMLWALANIRAERGAVADDAAVSTSASIYRGSESPVADRLPIFLLRDYRGDQVSSRDLSRDVVVLTFLDSQCEDACPGITAALGRTVDSLSPRERQRVRVVAISTDPREDTFESVQAFLAKQRAIGRLTYVTGPARGLRRVWGDFKILPSEESGSDSLHSAPVRIYREGVWVATQHLGVDLLPTNLRHDIRVALKTSR
jgi:cytochrome oxidase Cu insertion factor (SCO1/SenC/PrrC family)